MADDIPPEAFDESVVQHVEDYTPLIEEAALGDRRCAPIGPPQGPGLAARRPVIGPAGGRQRHPAASDTPPRVDEELTGSRAHDLLIRHRDTLRFVLPSYAFLVLVLVATALVYSNGTPQGWSPLVLRWFMNAKFLGVAPVVWLFAVFVVVATLLLARTPFGRRIHVIGNSVRVARLSAVAVGRTLIGVVVLSAIVTLREGTI